MAQATYSSFQIRKDKEATWEVLKHKCEKKGILFNALFNSILTGLTGAVESYDPKTKTIKVNLGPVQIK